MTQTMGAIEFFHIMYDWEKNTSDGGETIALYSVYIIENSFFAEACSRRVK